MNVYINQLKNIDKVAKEKFYGEKKKEKKIWDVDVGNIVIWKLIKTNNITRNEWICQNFKQKVNKIMHLRVNDDKLLERYKIIWTIIENLRY